MLTRTIKSDGGRAKDELKKMIKKNMSLVLKKRKKCKNLKVF